MRTESFSSLFGRSYDQASDLLFPFSLKKWLTLALIIFLSGAGSTSFNGNAGGGRGRKDKKQEAPAAAQIAGQDEVKGEKSANLAPAQAGTQEKGAIREEGASQEESRRPPRKINWRTVAPIGAGVLFLITLFFLVLHSRFIFVFLNTLVNRTTEIGSPLREYSEQGASLFKARALLTVLLWTILGAAAAAGYFFMKARGISADSFDWKSFLRISIPAGLAALPVILFFGVVWWVISDVTVPVMYREKTTFMPAWGKSWGIFKANLGDFVLFFLYNILVGILLGICGMIAGLLYLLIALLAGGIIFGSLFAVFMLMAKMKTVFAVACVIAGVPFAVVFFMGLFMIGVPFVIFHNYLKLNFLTSLGEEHCPILP